MKSQSSITMKADVATNHLIFKVRHNKFGVMFGLDVPQAQAWIKMMDQGLKDLKKHSKQEPDTQKEQNEWAVRWIFRF